MDIVRKNGTFTVRAYRGDAKTLLAFNLAKTQARNLAGFTLQCHPGGQDPYYIYNNLQFKDPSKHTQAPKEPPRSSINAPIHKFRWVHVPGTVHQGIAPVMGAYAYTVTPRYFDANQSLLPLDPSLSVSVPIEVDSFVKKGLTLGFTRGYTQSQAFDSHFGKTALIQPKAKDLLFDTSQQSGVNAAGEKYTFAQEYEWLGSTAREKIFAILDEIENDQSLRLDVFAYDLNEPDFCNALLKLGKQKRVRIILDNASLHHNSGRTKPEDKFEALFTKAANKSLIKRGKFGRYAHDKVLLVRKAPPKKADPYQWGDAIKVLTGSTNFSVTGMYVNSNHVLIFDDDQVAQTYAEVFDEAWNDNVSLTAFNKTALAAKPYPFSTAQTPKTIITFSPHKGPYATSLMQAVADRIAQEGKQSKSTGSVLFAVMQISSSSKSKTKNVVYDSLNTLHKNQKIFSYGISDSPAGISLYPIGKKTGVLVTGKPVSTQLPAPFNQVRNIGGVGHQVHHKFVVCGFSGDDPVVYCGSSNLAEGGETKNGDNLLAIYDADVATVFAIEALLLVDHFNFLDSTSSKGTKKKTPAASKSDAAVKANWYLSTDDGWTSKYFDTSDLHNVDRTLFA